MAARSPPPKLLATATREEVEAAEDAGVEESIKAGVLARTVNWPAYHDSGIITARELGRIVDYDKKYDDQSDLLNDLGREYASFFVHALDKILDKDTVQYLLTLIDELLHVDPRRAVYFHEVKDTYAPFMAILHRAAVAAAGSSGANVDTYSVLKAANILGVLLGEAGEQADVTTVTNFSKWLVATLGSSAGSGMFRQREILRMLESIKLLLKSPVAQSILANENGLKCFERHFIGATKSFQLIYVSGFCIWLLTFSKDEAVEGELKRFEIIRRIMEILQHQLKEKVHRMCFNILRNLLRMRTASDFVEQLVGFDGAKVLSTLAAKKWKDADIGKDVNIVFDTVTRKISELSSFEMYVTELETKNLRWGPVHTEQFWSEHKNKFEEKNFDYIRKLVALLDADEGTQEVACYDLGEFARFHPEGKRLVSILGGKSKLMVRMASANVKIAKQALLAVQKLMVQNWEFLQQKK